MCHDDLFTRPITPGNEAPTAALRIILPVENSGVVTFPGGRQNRPWWPDLLLKCGQTVHMGFVLDVYQSKNNPSPLGLTKGIGRMTSTR
jgi:hypothetical protein